MLRRLAAVLGVLATSPAPLQAADEPPADGTANGGTVGVRDSRTIATTVCSACHGADGNSAIPMFPKLGGQHSIYLAKQLDDYYAGRRKNEVMAGILATVPRAAVPGLAAYFAGQPPSAAPAAAPADAALVAQGRRLYESGRAEDGIPACGACHDAGGMAGQRYPRLAGQSAVYLVQTIGEFKSGARINDKGRVMRNIAARLDESDLQAVSAYLASR